MQTRPEHRAAPRSPVPVVVVRGEHDRSADDEVVVGIDGSECSRHALAWAAGWAEAHDKTLVAVLAWNYLEPQGPTGPEHVRPDYQPADAEAAARQIVGEVLGSEHGLRVVIETECDLPARAVLARAEHACLVVVGRHGTARWAPPDLGATAVQVLHHASCPVAVIPEADGAPDASSS